MIENAIKFDESQVVSLIKQEIDLHPASNIYDIYKLMYQACYGPSHLDSNHIEIKQYICAELSDMSDYYPIIQDIGLGAGYVRISLTALNNVKDPNLAIDQLAQAMLSSKLSYGIPLNEWMLNWTMIIQLILREFNQLIFDSDVLTEMAKNGSQPHHSSEYSCCYKPHYRVIHTNELHRLDFITRNK